jgi:hypothetical protein
VEKINVPSSHRTQRLDDGHRAGYIGDGSFQTASEIKAMSAFDMSWSDMRESLSDIDEENMKYQYAIRGESLEEYDIEAIPLDNRY